MLLSGIMTSTGLSVQGAYISLNTGYGYDASSQNIGTSTYTNDGSNNTSYHQEDISFGKGFNLGVQPGTCSLKI